MDLDSFMCAFIFARDSPRHSYPFVLKAVQKDGLMCAWCPWYRYVEETDDICSVAKDSNIQILNALRGMAEILGPTWKKMMIYAVWLRTVKYKY